MSKALSAVVLAAVLAGGCAISRGDPAPTQFKAAVVGEPLVVDGGRTLSARDARAAIEALTAEGETDLLRNHLRQAAGGADSPIVLGNAAKLLVDGPQTHRSMFDSIRSARHHVHLHSYIVAADVVGERMAELLAAKVREGVRVRLMYDSVGSLDTPVEFFDDLRKAGVAVCEFNPVNPLKAKGAWHINNRNHRKVLVVDGRTGYTGGINISSVYASGSFGSGQKSTDAGWRDTHVRVDGPIVAQLQKLFMADWASQANCPGLDDDRRYFPKPEKRGRRAMQVLAGQPQHGNETYALLLSAIEHAERSVYLTYGYFVPDRRTIETLTAAARRGVDVKLALPGFSDFWAPVHAGRSHYSELLGAGVKVYERYDALLHAKTAVIDGVWSAVGSTNLDWRSFLHNFEADVVVFDDAFGGELEKLFALDLQHSREVTRAEWEERGTWTRLKEWFARRWEYLL